MKKRLLAMLLAVVITVGLIPTYTVVPAAAADVEMIAKYAAKGAVEYGAAQIPVVGPAASSILGAMVGSYLGVPSLGSISGKLDEIMEKLDQIYAEVMAELNEIKGQLDEMQVQLDESTQELLNEFFKQNAFVGFDNSLTSVLTKTEELYSDLYAICESSDTEEYKMLAVAELLSFDNDSTDSYVNSVLTLSKYLDGNQVSFTNKRGLYDNAFLAGCKNSLLGGEAAMRVAPYLNRVNGTISDSYRMILMVLEAKNYVVDNLNDLKVKAKTNRKLAAKMKTLKDDYLDSYTKKKQDFTDKYHHYFFNDNGTSVVQKYNKYVESHWFDYINDYTIANGDAQVEFFALAGTLNTQSISKSMWNIQKAQAVNTAVATNDTTKKLLNNGFGADKTKKLIEHLQNNGNGVFVNMTSSDIQKTLIEVLEDYGFEIPKKNENTVFAAGAKCYDCGNVLDDRSLYAELYITGYDATQTVRYSQGTGKPYSATPSCDETLYYDYHYSSNGPTLEQNEAKDYLFLFFKAGDVNINNEDDFVSFIRSVANGRSYNGTTVNLNSDLDLNNIAYQTLWTGMTEETYKEGFRGTFNGNDHTVKSLTDTGSGAYGAGLFRSLGNGANISNLNFEDVSISAPEGNAGALAGRAYCVKSTRGVTVPDGTATIQNITVKDGKITGKNDVGGVVGHYEVRNLTAATFFNGAEIIAESGSAGGVIGSSSTIWRETSDCKNTGAVTAKNANAGGIVGYEDGEITFKDSSNTGAITGKNAGGIVGQIGGYGVDAEKCSNSGVIQATQHAGGVIGYVAKNRPNCAGCTNTGDVTADTGDAGGIIGCCGAANYTPSFSDCTNTGAIKGGKYAAGIAAEIHYADVFFNFVASHCINKGTITGNDYTGGVFGYLNIQYSEKNSIKNCENHGDVTSAMPTYAGGIVAYTKGGGTMTDNKNTGDITGKTTGGILGGNEKYTIDLSRCKNEGTIEGAGQAGGIAGYLGDKNNDEKCTLVSCVNTGKVTGVNNAGGIVGYLKTDNVHHDFNHCVNNGNVKSTTERAGGIIGYCCGGGDITYCTNTGRITAKGKRDQIIGEIEDDKCDLTGCVCNGSVAAASILSEGNVWIIGGVALAAIIAALALLLKKKKAGAAAKTAADESADTATGEREETQE